MVIIKQVHKAYEVYINHNMQSSLITFRILLNTLSCIVISEIYHS